MNSLGQKRMQTSLKRTKLNLHFLQSSVENQYDLNIKHKATLVENILTPAKDFWMFSLARAMSCRIVLAPTSFKDKITHSNKIISNFSDTNPKAANQQLPVLALLPVKTHSFAHRSTFLLGHSEVYQTRSSPEPESPLMSWFYSR